MISWCHSLKSAITSDSKWKASIPFSSSYASSLNDAMQRNLDDESFSLSRKSSFSSTESLLSLNKEINNSENDKLNNLKDPLRYDLSNVNNIISENETFDNQSIKFDTIYLSNLPITNLEKKNKRL